MENVTYDTFRDTCRALGTLQDDQLWHMTMEDAKQLKLPMQMRELFVMLMTFSEINDPKALFEAMKGEENMMERIIGTCATQSG